MITGQESLRRIRVASLAAAVIGFGTPAPAHNDAVHKGFVRDAYVIMQRASRADLDHRTLGPAPAGMSQADWVQFHHDVTKALAGLSKLTGKSNGTGSDWENTPAGPIAESAIIPDYNYDDTHLFVKPLSALGLGTLSKGADEAQKLGLELALIPIICACDCFASFVGLSDGDTCKECVDHASDLADKVPDLGDFANLVPGIGDLNWHIFTGLWHFVNMGPLLPNKYDDHQGMLYETAGPYRVPGSVDALILVATSIAGFAINPEKSDGVKHYEIPNPGDAFPDGDSYNGSVKRGDAAWQKYPMGHTPFSPVDNLALFGWNSFRLHGGAVADLGYPLHALGDATVPMHVTGTTSYGHRPFEDAQSELYQAGKFASGENNVTILQQAARYRAEILQYRATGHPGDIPIRRLVREVARNTYDNSMADQAATLLDPAGAWPFNDAASLAYFLAISDGGHDLVTTIYRDRSDAVARYQPMLNDGIAAVLAFLTSVPEAPVTVADRSNFGSSASAILAPGGSSNVAPAVAQGAAEVTFASYQPEAAGRRAFDINRRASPGAPVIKRGPGRAIPTSPSAQETITPPPATTSTGDPAQDAFLAAMRFDYAALSRQFVAAKLTPSQFFQRIQDRARKADRAEREPGYYAAWVKGDADGDLVPDDRDASPGTPKLSPTDDRGAVVADAPPATFRGRPVGPTGRDMQTLFARTKLLLAAGCVNQPIPATPRLLGLGYGFNDRDLLFIVDPAVPTDPKCPAFYDFSVRFPLAATTATGFPASSTYHETVFRSDQSADLHPDGTGRLVFRIVRAQQQIGERQALLQGVAGHGKVEWRARALGSNGAPSDWSEWTDAPFRTFAGQ